MSKLVFSSDQLPAELDDQARFTAWCDFYLGTICHFDLDRLPHLPFSIRFEVLKIGGVSLASCEGTARRFTRRAQHVAADSCDDFFLNMNGSRPWAFNSRGHSHEFVPHATSFLTTTEPGHGDHAGGASFRGIVLPRARVCEVVKNPDDLLCRTFDPQDEATRHLWRYTDMLLAEGSRGQDLALASHLETTLLDLAALILKGRRDAVELARLRGLRAARLQAILAEIGRGFARGDFSPQHIAPTLGLSVNYIQKILNEAGATFTERVLELRVQKARAMLADRRNDLLKVSEIALACGFNEVSYFNRCFRRRFGAAPNEFRATSAH